MDEIRIVDNSGELQCTLALDANLIAHHWWTESSLFEEELDRWTEFRRYQQTMPHKPLLKLSFDQGSLDQRLIDILTRLNDWREYQHYQQQVKIGNALKLSWKHRRVIKKILDGEAIPGMIHIRPEIGCRMSTYFDNNMVSYRQTEMETAQMRLVWIDRQILEILAEACGLLEADIPLQQQLETKLVLQANTFDQELKRLEARPSRSVQVPLQSAGFSQRICHWGSEINRLMHDHFECRLFGKWRKLRPTTEQTAFIGEQVASGRLSDLQVWEDWVAYRQYQLDSARIWEAGWQQLLTLSEKEINTTPREHLYMLEITISDLRAKVDKLQQDVQVAELQVRSAEQQLDDFAQQRPRLGTSYTTEQITTRPSLPLGPLDSESTAIIYDDSTLPKGHWTTSSTVSPVTGIPSSVQSSHALNKEEEIQAKRQDPTTRQPIPVAEAAVPHQITADNDFQTTDAPRDSYSDAVTGDGEKSGLLQFPKTAIKDTLMNDVEDLVTTCSGGVSKVLSKCRSTRIERKSPLPTRQALTSRKTRSAKTLDQSFSGRVLKHAGKKPARNPKASARKGTKAILNTTSLEEYLTSSPPPRRSQRLKEKAAASVPQRHIESTSLNLWIQ